MESTSLIVTSLITLLAAFSLFFIILFRTAILLSVQRPAVYRKRAVLYAIVMATTIALVTSFALPTMSISSGILFAVFLTVATGIVIYILAPFMMR